VALFLGAVVVLLLPRLTRRLRAWRGSGRSSGRGSCTFAVLLSLQWLAYGAAFRLLEIGLLGNQGGAGQARGVLHYGIHGELSRRCDRVSLRPVCWCAKARLSAC